MKFFGRAKKNEMVRRRNIETAEITFQNYRRGTTLTSFSDEQREKTERQKEKTLRAKRRKIGVAMLIFFILCACGVVLVIEHSGSLDTVLATGAKIKRNRSDKYIKIANEYFSKNPLEKFGFLRNNDRLDKYMVENLAEIKSIKIEKTGFMSSELVVELRKPLVAWHTGGTTNYVDEGGAVFTENYFPEPEIQIVDKNSIDSEKPTASAAFLKSVGQIVAKISEFGETVNRIEIPAGAIRYVEIYLSNREYPFKTQIDRDPSSQASDIIAMAKYIDDHGITPAYVDCRVAGKGYWK
ncbi:hypothetical protein FWF74_03265 [Candidatus Saccharibacteria bacterium]|nr:hypothetical protein [Candidatus Saccharibacteria bacterium]MCL1962804.1 hypothetical protein [Candidatus Saccharibacteria bacterium]